MLRFLLILTFFALPVVADEPDRAADEASILAASEAYLTAIERGDQEAIRNAWTEDGDLIDSDGQRTTAAEMAKGVSPAVDGGTPRVTKILARAVHFIGDGVAVEDGTATHIIGSGDDAYESSGRFTAVWVKRDDAWKLSNVRVADSGKPSEPAKPAPKPLAALGLLVGHWTGERVDDLGNVRAIEITAAWGPNEAFIEREVTGYVNGRLHLVGRQHIGYDAQAKQIVSRTFNSDGSQASGEWHAAGDGWVILSSGSDGEGKATSATNILTLRNEHTLEWHNVGRRRGEQSLPNETYTLTRTELVR